MRLVNHTDFPDEKIREIFEFCAEPLKIDVMKVVCEKRLENNGDGFSWSHAKEIQIRIRNDTSDKTTYPYFWGDYNKRSRYDTVLRNYTANNYMYNEETRRWVPKPGYKETFRKTGNILHLVLSKEEGVVNTIAHELRHQWQKKRRPRSEWCFGSNNGKHTKIGIEIDASAYGLKMQRIWRKLHAVDIYREPPDLIKFQLDNEEQFVLWMSTMTVEVPVPVPITK